MGKIICNSLELLRWIGIIAAFQIAFYFGKTPLDIFDVFAPIMIISISGLTGIESVFFGKYANQQSGYTASRYQIQSGFNNLAVAIAVGFVWFFNWGVFAYAALMIAVLFFYGLSAINHGLSYFCDKNKAIKNLLRPLMTLVLIVAVLFVMIPALR